jgi:DNA adenine methylase
VRPPFPYFGGKIGLAPLIVSMMPEHRVYIEPFLGSGAVLFAKPACEHEIVNDAAGAVVAFFRCLRDCPADLERVCKLTPYARDEFTECVAGLYEPDLEPLELARRFWCLITQGFGSAPKPTTGFSRSAAGGPGNSHPARVYAAADRFIGIAHRLMGVTVEHTDAVELIDTMAKTADTVVYADPPYPGSTRSATSDTGYLVEMRDDVDHERLAGSLHATPATVLLSGYHCELYDRLYDDWWHVDIERSSHTSRGRSSRPLERTEVIWSNRAIAGHGRLF